MFAKLLGRIDFENLMVVNQAELAKELGMHRQHVQRSIKRLIALGVILEGPKIGISRSYRLNPEFGWKGSARNHVIALDQERKKRMANAGIKGVIEGGQQARRKPQSATRTRWTCSPSKSTRGAYRVPPFQSPKRSKGALTQTSFVVLRSKARIHKASLRFAWSVPL